MGRRPREFASGEKGAPHALGELEDPAEVAWPADAVEVGRVVGAWGVKGWLKVLPHSADPQGLFSTKRWWLGSPEGPSRVGVDQGRYPRLLKVIEARVQGDWIVAAVRGIEDRDAAQSLAGSRVNVPRSSFPTPEPDEFYWVDLVGTVVVNREGIDLGTVSGLRETGPHCVLILSSQDSQGQQRMIPFVAAYVDRVDLIERRIVVDWPIDY